MFSHSVVVRQIKMASIIRSALPALRPLARGYATSVTGMGKEVEGFVGAIGNTPLVSLSLIRVERSAYSGRSG